jgi:hypothetical protein
MKYYIHKVFTVVMILAVSANLALAIGPVATSKAARPAESFDKQINVASSPARPSAKLDVRLFTRTVDYKRVGEYVNYLISVQNQGAVPVYNVLVDEPELLISVERAVTVLQPGEWAIYSATHVITAEDVRAGRIVHQVKAIAQYQNGTPMVFSGNRVILNYRLER